MTQLIGSDLLLTLDGLFRIRPAFSCGGAHLLKGLVPGRSDHIEPVEHSLSLVVRGQGINGRSPIRPAVCDDLFWQVDHQREMLMRPVAVGGLAHQGLICPGQSLHLVDLGLISQEVTVPDAHARHCRCRCRCLFSGLSHAR